VRDHSGGFVDDDDLAVFVDDVERNVFGNGVNDWRGGTLADDLLARPDAVAGFDGFTVDRNVAPADRPLNRRPARFAEPGRQEEIEALIFGFGGN
jgi:hypothetical protein